MAGWTPAIGASMHAGQRREPDAEHRDAAM